MGQKILAIESSCDETAAAVYDSQKGMLSNELFSQMEIHAIYGGVVPEVASRAHLEKINSVVEQALTKAGVQLKDIDAIAVTSKPGLPGALLVGLCFAKGLAWALNKPIIGINHLEGHVFSAQIENDIPFPYLCITASGGHTSFYLVEDFGKFRLIGQTIDDAAGEAFDKIAKLIGLPYPGGPEIEKLAQKANFKDYFNYPRPKSNSFDFSFSGLKTAVLYDLVKRGAYDLKTKTFLKPNDKILKEQVASSLLVAICDVFKQKLKLGFKRYPEVKAVAFVGGVACNNYIREQLKEFCTKHGKQFFTPSAQYCTDNAGMIAFVGNYKAKNKDFSALDLDILD